MIKSFGHQGLEQFYRNGSKSGVALHHVHDLRSVLNSLACAEGINDIHLDNAEPRVLAGDLSGYYSLELLPNWHIVFKFDHKDVSDVRYVHLPTPREWQ
jgi:proteic killer suppression protein